MSGITDDQIVALWTERKQAQGIIINRMRDVMNAYNGDTVVLLPDMDQSSKPAIANLLKQSLDQTAMRISGVDPLMDWPALRPHIQASVQKAKDRKQAAFGWWEANSVPKKLKRRARHLIGYASSPVAITPDHKRGIPQWHVRNPLTTYPAPTSDPDDLTPEDVIFAYQKPMGWLERCYPEAFNQLRTNSTKRSDMVEIVEYNDADETILIAVGKVEYSMWTPTSFTQDPRTVRLEQYANLAKRPRVVVPGRITLDRPMGQFDGILPLKELQAKLMALEVIAVERGIFPDMYLEGFPTSNQLPTLVSGDWKDGRTGEINIIQNGTAKTLSMNPGVFGTQIIDRLQQAQMQESLTPAEFGGLSPSNIRTNARGQAVTSTTIEPNIAESQAVLAESLQEENKIAVAVAKGWFGGAPKSFYVNWKGAKGPVTYVPNETFETDDNSVSFPLAGTDQQNLTIAVESLAGSNLLSKKTARWLHPMIDDPDAEEVQIAVEALENVGLTMLEQQATQGQLPWQVYVDTIKAVRARQMTVEDALAFADQERKKLQAQQAMQPAQPGTPEAQPGAGPQGAPPIGPPPQGLANTGQLAQILGSLHRTAQAS